MSLIVRNITKVYKDTKAVEDVSFSLKEGKMLGFLGRNGAGKTTTFRMILGLTEMTRGEVLFWGEKMTNKFNNQIGYLPEERGLHPKLTVSQELFYLASLKGMNKKEIKKEVSYWMKKFDIEENINKKIESLSKGNQQKIQLIASLIHKPKLLILDEPFSGLDPINVELLKRAVIELNSKGTMIIFSSHRMDHVEELCDDICLINKGKLVLNGSINDIKKDYGYKKVIIEGNIDFSRLSNVPGVSKMETNKKQSIFKIENYDAAELLFNEVKDMGFIQRFQIVEPSLNDIYIDQVGEKNE
ncbi:ABC transporter ATP-binding protein [Bacillus ginsengihumi]|uniref:ABC transporter ATP-binding protein n=1 Tax=Heyndrickxia ginsengihumi TaxID=363870 RepID=A0A6M0PB97_9BACI|nr:ABC transporter ATP-binding protein [Heyndrickxia ginsengihumi]NEY21707.1 ABC transporter ATP-binding protein [Heyndrickxia ginsengihumi]